MKAAFNISLAIFSLLFAVNTGKFVGSRIDKQYNDFAVYQEQELKSTADREENDMYLDMLELKGGISKELYKNKYIDEDIAKIFCDYAEEALKIFKGE